MRRRRARRAMLSAQEAAAQARRSPPSGLLRLASALSGATPPVRRPPAPRDSGGASRRNAEGRRAQGGVATRSGGAAAFRRGGIGSRGVAGAFRRNGSACRGDLTVERRPTLDNPARASRRAVGFARPQSTRIGAEQKKSPHEAAIREGAKSRRRQTLRRRDAKPMAPRPASSSAALAGSGTADTLVEILTWSSSAPTLSLLRSWKVTVSVPLTA